MCKSKEPCWTDWEKSMGSFGLCYDCLGIYMSEECEDFIECPTCKSKFKPKEVWQKVCIGCWNKNKYEIKLSVKKYNEEKSCRVLSFKDYLTYRLNKQENLA